jgi:hypothetical protein
MPPPLVWVHHSGVVPPLQQPYDSAYLVRHCRPRSFTVRVGNRKEIVSTGSLKPCTDNTAGPGVPSCLGRLPSTGGAAKLAAHCHSNPPAMKRVSFLAPLVSTPSQRYQEKLSILLGNDFVSPHRGVFAHSKTILLHRRGTCNASGHCQLD